MNPIIAEIYRTQQVQDAQGQHYPLQGEIDPGEGELLFQLVQSDSSIRRTLEVGCANGLASMHLCAALASRDQALHTIIDPFQSTDWHGVGISNLRRSGYDHFELIEEPSEFALPRLAQSHAGEFDLAFIDGWHTFDHTLLDLFYANRLVRVGGYIVVDDTTQPAVAKAVSYLSRYPAYKILPGLAEAKYGSRRPQSWSRRMAKTLQRVVPPGLAGFVLPRVLYDRYYVRLLYPSMVVLQKISTDERSWSWFDSF